jgi:hypothetical protein
MEGIEMKTARFFTMAFVGLASLPLMAQHVDADGSAESSSHVDTTQGPMGFGDEAASHAYEMSSVTGELQGKLDAKTAKVGDRVVLKTTDKVQTADGTLIPRGTRLVGHITQVQALDSTHGGSLMGIAFDRAELKNGQSIAIHTLIQGVRFSSSTTAISSVNDDAMGTVSSAAMNGVGSGSGNGTGRGGRSGGGVLDGAGGLANGTVQRTSTTTSSVGEQAGADTNPNAPGAVQMPGPGDPLGHTGAHELAAARAIPHPTAIPGVMLAGSSTASGVFSVARKDVQFESGTQMPLGLVADR